MEGSRVSDFSIERILSPQLGHKPPLVDGHVQGFSLDSGGLRPPAPAPIPVPVPGCLQYRGLRFGEAFYPYGAGIHHETSIYSNPGVYVHFSSPDSAAGPLICSEAQSLAGCHGYQQASQKARTRTVFTDSQTKQLEALFELTDYPALQARAEVARRSGLSEETVRVWFKNRRARRKRQRSGSKVKSPSRPCSAAAEKKLFTTFL